jgi:GxxExxY protein
MDIEVVASHVVDAGFHLHRELGPGLLESVYEALFEKELTRRGLAVVRQKRIRFEWDGLKFDHPLRVDMIVEGCVLVELKSIETLLPIHSKVVLTYLRLLNLPLGLLLNFGAATMKEGTKRILNNYTPPGPPAFRSR